ncbi:TPA: imidazole glycerol phosphate synthase subunit HisF [Candidatus Micrarchaeota archaeon]|nr:imidazole glycerol phosphate synthase subunit HisF [Candidatus Micrarchaeota archaeon]
MLAKRIIPCLDVKEGAVVKGTKFQDLKRVSNPVALASKYYDEGADEIVFLDIAASRENRKTVFNLVRETARKVFVPLTVGGGIVSLGDFSDALQNGADKVSINTTAVREPQLISKAADRFGSQCVVVSIDAKKTPGGYRVFVSGGSKETPLGAVEWAVKCQDLGAGEILLTSIDADGTKKGFNSGLTREISEKLSIPVIASGGAGSMQDFFEVLSSGKADAALGASVFHYGEFSVSELKQFLDEKGILVRI